MYESGISKKQGAYLPHWTTNDGIYFVTFRLAGSLPSHLAEERETLRKEILASAEKKKRNLTPWELDELEELHFQEVDAFRNDQKVKHLSEDKIASVVADALRHFEGERYTLFAWCIMPNHVHVVFQPLPGWNCPSIIQSWKRHSARQANIILSRTGTFWYPDYHDYLIRDEDDLQRCIEYTWLNPEKAGLKHWKWRWRITEEKNL